MWFKYDYNSVFLFNSTLIKPSFSFIYLVTGDKHSEKINWKLFNAPYLISIHFSIIFRSLPWNCFKVIEDSINNDFWLLYNNSVKTILEILVPLKYIDKVNWLFL